MTLSELLKNIRKLKREKIFDNEYIHDEISVLFKAKNYKTIAEIFLGNIESIQSWGNSFEIAYSLSEVSEFDRARAMYEKLLDKDPQNRSILNNLYVLESKRNNWKQAWKYIQRAYELSPDDEIVSKNYNRQLQEINEIEERERVFKLSADKVENENNYVLDKLRTFFTNATKDQDFLNGKIPIAQWKIAVLMGAEKERALSLFDQWMRKDYVIKTDERGDHREPIYEINPFLMDKIRNIKAKEILPTWISGIERLTATTLSELEYYLLQDKVAKIKKNYRIAIMRDLNELYIAYIMQSWKTVIILCGSILEFVLIYDQEKKKISTIEYSRQGKVVSKALYACDLGDLLAFYDEKGLLSRSLVHLGNVSRIFRNFIHPGKELRDEEILDKAKADLCFIGAKEILKDVL